jgi:hypothetical protein
MSNNVINCKECNHNPGKSIRFIEDYICVSCSDLPKYKFITKTDAKNEYLVKDIDLEDLESHQVKSSYGHNQYASLYNKLEVMKKACERYSTTLEALPGVLDDKKQEKQNKSRERKIKIQEKRNAIEASRRNKLIASLIDNGLELRADSRLCQLYIEGKIDNLEYVVRRMGEMRYLYEYCHMDECCDEAYHYIQEERSLFGHCDWLVQDKAEQIALKKYSSGRYPVVFPWQK